MREAWMSVYAARVKRADAVELVALTYELTLLFIEKAIENQNDDANWRGHLEKCVKTIAQLTISLNFSQPIAADLYALYRYADRRLRFAASAHDLGAAREVSGIFRALSDGWRAAKNTPVRMNKSYDFFA
jgi:flagellar biosynthetic protein FliS